VQWPQLGWCCARHGYWTMALHKVIILFSWIFLLWCLVGFITRRSSSLASGFCCACKRGVRRIAGKGRPFFLFLRACLMDGWMNGWMDEWMDGCVCICIHVCCFIASLHSVQAAISGRISCLYLYYSLSLHLMCSSSLAVAAAGIDTAGIGMTGTKQCRRVGQICFACHAMPSRSHFPGGWTEKLGL
jgi:hypothetical protein